MRLLTAFLAAMVLLLAAGSASASAATRYVTPTGSGTACTVVAPCGSFQTAYNAAASGDDVQVASGSYAGQGVSGGTKSVSFTGSTGVVLHDLGVDAPNLLFDGINIDSNGNRGVAFYVNAPNTTFRNAFIRDVLNNQMVLNTNVANGNTFDNVRFTDAVRTDPSIHMECIFTQGPNVTIKNSYFENCAVMDVFFTRCTYCSPEQAQYGGFTLIGNTFKAPKDIDGTDAYYSVMWAWQNVYDNATVRNNTYEAGVTAQKVDGSPASFTNSVESCNTPAFNLPGMVKESCVPPDPTPTPTPSPTPTPTPTPTPPPDTQAPSVPQGMAWTTITSSSIGLRWDASTDNVGVTGYRIYKNGVLDGTTTGTTYSVSGLACATSYTIGLTAIDAAGNESNVAEATGTTSTSACPLTARVGTETLQTAKDWASRGEAEAFRYVASSTGNITTLKLYVPSADASNPVNTTKVELALYNGSGSPGWPTTLKNKCVVNTVVKGAWNTCTIPATAVTSGTVYWLSVLAPMTATGDAWFLDKHLDGGTGQVRGGGTGLSTHGTNWSQGWAGRLDGPASFAGLG